MKVLMIGNHQKVHGGITSVISQMLKHDWTSEGIDMNFIPTYEGGNKVHKITFFLYAYSKIKKFIKTQNPDIIHIHMSHTGSFYRANAIHKLCKKYGVKDIIHLHGSEFKKFYTNSSKCIQKKIEHFFEECGCIITLGEEWYKFVKSIAEDSNVVVLNNTVAIPNHIANPNTKKVNVLFLGVLVERKGVQDLLEAIKKLHDDKILEKFNVIVKIGGTGPQERELREYVIKHELQQYVEFLGWIGQEEKQKQLANSQIFVLPSYNEGLPIAILEAMSYGLPIIATKVGSVGEAVTHKNGYLIEPGDISQLYFALRELIMNETLRESMKKGSREIVQNTFNEQNYFAKVVELYKE